MYYCVYNFIWIHLYECTFKDHLFIKTKLQDSLNSVWNGLYTALNKILYHIILRPRSSMHAKLESVSHIVLILEAVLQCFWRITCVLMFWRICVLISLFSFHFHCVLFAFTILLVMKNHYVNLKNLLVENLYVISKDHGHELCQLYSEWWHGTHTWEFLLCQVP